MEPTSGILILPALSISGTLSTSISHVSGDTTISTILAWWPYIIALIFVLLAFLWYQQIRMWLRQKKGQTRRHTARGNQLTMLAIVTVFALIVLAAPRFIKRYENLFTPQAESPMDPANRTELTLKVEGMTCTGCESAVQRRVAELPGVESVVADHEAGLATVVYDRSRTDQQTIASTIAGAGYKVVD